MAALMSSMLGPVLLPRPLLPWGAATCRMGLSGAYWGGLELAKCCCTDPKSDGVNGAGALLKLPMPAVDATATAPPAAGCCC